MQMSYRLVDADEGDVRLPESTEIVPPKYPGGEVAADEAQRTRRVQLVLWMTSRDNDFFSRAAVNWAWSHLFGRGWSNRSTTIRQRRPTRNCSTSWPSTSSTPVSTCEICGGRWPQRGCTNSPAEQTEASAAPPKHFARMLAKPLTPEQLYDSFSMLAPLASANAGPYAAQANSPIGGLDEDPLRADFVRRMRPPPGSATEYRAGTLQALMLMNGRAMADITATAAATCWARSMRRS